jgi:hypothetical protein
MIDGLVSGIPANLRHFKRRVCELKTSALTWNQTQTGSIPLVSVIKQHLQAKTNTE